MFGIWRRDAYDGKGEMSIYNGRSFCPKCGSHVVHLSENEAEVMIGSLDQVPSDLAPEYELWTPRREIWLHALPWASQFTGDRDQDLGG